MESPGAIQPARCLYGELLEDPLGILMATAPSFDGSYIRKGRAVVEQDAQKLEKAKELLKHVMDPELGMSIVDLGLVYNVEITEDNNVGIDMTLTTQNCPIGPMLQMQAQYALKSALPDVNQVDVRLVFDPPWTPDRMSERLKKARAMGLL